MSDAVSLLHQCSRYSHIILGFLGLILFWIPVCSPKGSRLHRISGKAFALVALWVSGTGILASAWAIIDPISFITSLGTQISGTDQPYVVESIRFLFSLLAFLSVGTFSGVIFGVALVWTKSRHEALRNVWVIGALSLTILVASALALFGAWNLWLSAQGEHLLAAEKTRKYWISLILGGIGALGTWADLRYVLRPPPFKLSWFCKHLECMLGTGIAFYTAFLVFGASRWLEHMGIKLPGAWAILPWILPSLVGLPLISWWANQYKRKFNGVPGA